MRFALSEEEAAVGELSREMLRREAPLDRNLALALDSTGFSRALYEQIGRLGLFASSIPEEAGGAGLPFVAAGEFARAAGFELVPGPWPDQIVGVELLSKARVGAMDLEPALTGRRLMSLIPLSNDLQVVAADRSDRVSVSGVAKGLAFARSTDVWILVAADHSDRCRVLAVEPEADGINLTDTDTGDTLWRDCSVKFDQTPATTVGSVPRQVAAAANWCWAALTASAAIGGSQRLIEFSVQHATDRYQFGVPIGSFQAIKHRLARDAVTVQHASKLTQAALAMPAAEQSRGVAMAKVLADNTYRAVAESTLQVHGGLGFTWEIPIHHFLRNAVRLRRHPQPTDWYVQWLANDLRDRGYTVDWPGTGQEP